MKTTEYKGINVSKLVREIAKDNLKLFFKRFSWPIALLLLPLFVHDSFVLHILIFTALNVILAVSLRFIALTGQLSMAHGGMMAIGAYTSAILMTKLGLSSWIGLLSGGLLAGLVAFAGGWAFSHLKGIYFSMVTIFFAQVVNLTAEQWEKVTGGLNGIFNIPRPSAIVIGGFINIDFSQKEHFYLFVVALMLITIAVLYLLERSRLGLSWAGVNESELISASVGVHVRFSKVLTFSIGSFFAGLAGAFYSQYVTIINPGTFGFTYAIYIIVFMVVGGTKKMYGPVLGACVLTLLPEFSYSLKEYQPFVFVAIMMLTIFFIPKGLIDVIEKLRSRYRENQQNKEAYGEAEDDA